MTDIIKDNYSGIFEEQLLDEIAQVAKFYEFKEGDIPVSYTHLDVYKRQELK